MSHAPAPAAPSRIPVLGVLSPVARTAILVTLGASALAIAMDLAFQVEGAAVFVASAAAILGLAWVIGLSTERLGALTGPQVGGVLNATFGNIAELIIAFFALQAGLITVVKASLTGSIIGNLLLVLGAAILTGGLKNGLQTFPRPACARPPQPVPRPRPRPTRVAPAPRGRERGFRVLGFRPRAR